MGTTKAGKGRLGSRVLDIRQPGSAVPRLILGARLQRLREDCGLTREQAGAAIELSSSRISRLESGRSGCEPRDVAHLLTLYGVVDEAERATALALVDEANAPGWWQPYCDLVPPRMQTYFGLEQVASLIRCFDAQFVPGLLQTADYVRAVSRLRHPYAPEAEIERRVELQVRRQNALHRPEPVHLWAVIDEAALRRAIGGAPVMRAQIQHLIDILDLPHVTLQILPFEADRHTAAAGPITLFRLPGGELPDVVFLEQSGGALRLDEQDDVDHYWHVMNRLVTAAERAPATRTLLHWILNDL